MNVRNSTVVRKKDAEFSTWKKVEYNNNNNNNNNNSNNNDNTNHNNTIIIAQINHIML